MSTHDFIKAKIIEWKKKLGIKRKILWTSDFKEFCNLDKTDCQFSREQVFGATATNSDKDRAIIFINISKHEGNEKNLENTVVHELLHVKNPDWSEPQVREETKRLLE